MITRSRKLFCCSFAAILFLAIISGCAQSRSVIKDDGPASAVNNSAAVIQSIKVSDDASQVEIRTDKPLSYTYYKTTEPPKVVIDIAQTVPGVVAKTMEVNAGNIKRIEVEKHEFTGGFLSRIEIIPEKEVGDFSVSIDSVDKGKLLVRFAKPPIEEKPSAAAKEGVKTASQPENTDKPGEIQPQPVIKEAAKPVATVEANVKPETQQTSPAAGASAEARKDDKATTGEMGKVANSAEGQKSHAPVQAKVLSSVMVNDEGIEITIGGGVDTYNAFKLTKPDRIVLDMPGIKNGLSAASVTIGRFGVGKARVGKYPGKVRIVLDADKGTLSAYQVVKTDNGLKIIIGEATVKPPVKEDKEPATIAAVTPVETNKVAAQGASPESKNEGKQPDAGVAREAKADVEPKSDPPVQQKVLNAIAANDEGIAVSISGGIDTFSAFKLTKPDRIVLDLPGVKSTVSEKPIAINKFGVGQVRLGTYPDKVRIVFDAEKDILPPHKVIKSANGLTVVFSAGPAKEIAKGDKEPGKESSASPAEPKVVDKPVPSAIEAIDFKIVDDYSRIALKLTGDCSAGKIVHVANGLSLTIHNCQIPGKLQRTIDTSGFPSVVQKIIPYQVKVKKGTEARIVVKLRQKVSDSSIKPEGNTVLWDIRNPENVKVAKTPLRQAKNAGYDEDEATAAPVGAYREKTARGGEGQALQNGPQVVSGNKGEKKMYTGRRVSLEFSDADIRKILQLIAEVSNMNFIIGDDVSGTISIKLVNVPWDQALDVILETKGLEKRQEGNIMYIKPKGKFKSEEQEEAEAKKEHERRMELKTQVFDVNFAVVGDIATQFEKLKSDRGTISKDDRTNRVIVTDIEDRIEQMRSLLKELDLPEKQVMIEARIVEASSIFTRDLGVQWGLHYRDGSASFLGINKVDLGLGGIVIPPPTSGTFSDTSSTTTGGAGGISFGKLSSSVQLDLRLSAAASVGQIKVISTPKVITLNNKSAKITQGQSIPYQTTSAEGTKTEFVEAALTLEVTPHVANDGSISMKIKASNDSAGTGTPPPINKKEATTEVQVMNGETTVIGGIYQDSDTENDTGVPFLQDIPLFGWLFKSNSKNKTKTELLIFITPKIVS